MQPPSLGKQATLAQRARNHGAAFDRALFGLCLVHDDQVDGIVEIVELASETEGLLDRVADRWLAVTGAEGRVVAASLEQRVHALVVEHVGALARTA